jgi:hypothetical protein
LASINLVLEARIYYYIASSQLSNTKKNKSSNSHYKNRFFESPTLSGFQKTDLGVSSTEGTGNTQIGLIIRIAETKVR